MILTDISETPTAGRLGDISLRQYKISLDNCRFQVVRQQCFGNTTDGIYTAGKGINKVLYF